MAENPTSSSTMETTLGAPAGAVGGSNGVQSGTESLTSTLIVPLNGLLTLCSSIYADGWSAEQLGLGGSELVVGQGALLMQGRELVQLIEQGRPGGRWRGCGWGRGRRLLLLEVADARVLGILRLC